MQTFKYPLTVFSADGSHCETVETLAGTRATYTALPSALLERLGIERRRRIRFELPDGSITEMEAGEAQVSIEGVKSSCIMVFADDGLPPLLGAEAIEGVAMEVDPEQPRLRPFRPRFGGLRLCSAQLAQPPASKQ